MDETRLMRAYPDCHEVKQIGQGSFGSVYEIRRDLPGKSPKAAVKILSIPQSSQEVDELFQKGYSADQITQYYCSISQNLLTQYQKAAQLQGQHHVTRYDSVQCIAREDVFGWDIFIETEQMQPLERHLDRLCSEREIVDFGQALCRALIACHDLGLVHGNIKVTEIFVTDSGEYKLGDFGVHRIMRDLYVPGRPTCGMAPEVAFQKRYSCEADIYSLGMVLYWLLNAHRMPFMPLPPQVPAAAQEQDAYEALFVGKPIPAPKNGCDRLKAIVLKACAFRPEDRYQNARQMLEDLQSLSKPVPTPAEPEAWDDPYAETVRLNWGRKERTVMPPKTEQEEPAPVIVPVETEVVQPEPETKLPPTTQEMPPTDTRKPAGKKRWPWILGAGVLTALLAAVLLMVGLFTTAWMPCELEYASGAQIKFTYDKKGQLSAITTQHASGSKVKQKYTYDKDGNPVLVLCYENGELVQRWEYTYEDGLATQMHIFHVTDSGTEEARYYLYQRDRNGKLLRSELFDASGNLLQRQTFTYDATDRCIESMEEHFSTGSTTLRRYTYDAQGNLTAFARWFNDYCTVSYSFSYDRQRRPIQRQLLQNGEVKSSVSYHYDDGNLVRVEVDEKAACTITYEKVRIRRKIRANLQALIADWIEENLLEID